MASRKRNEKYKGFDIEYFIVPKGFNQYKITISKYRFKGTKREEYFMEHIETYTSKLEEARKEARNFIDNLGEINWSSQGLSKATYLPD